MEEGFDSDSGRRPEDNLVGFEGCFNEESLSDNFKGYERESLSDGSIFDSEAGRVYFGSNKVQSGPIFILFRKGFQRVFPFQGRWL
jgi:hypothetical protein